MFVESGVRKDYLVSLGYAANLGELGTFMAELGDTNAIVSKYAVHFLPSARRFLDKEHQVTAVVLEACHRYVLTLYLYLGGAFSFTKDDERLSNWEYTKGCPWAAFTAKKPFMEMIVYVLRHTDYLREQEGRLWFGAKIIEEGDEALYAQLDIELVPEMLHEVSLPEVSDLSVPVPVPDHVPSQKMHFPRVFTGEELSDPVNWPERLVDMEEVVRVVAEYYGTTPQVLRGNNITRPIGYARRILFFMMNMSCAETQRDIAHYLGGRTGPAVCLASLSVQEKLLRDINLASEVSDLRNLLRAK